MHWASSFMPSFISRNNITIMSNSQLSRAANELNGTPTPITAICIIADKNKAPFGFTAVTKAADDGSDADLWRESSFSFFARPVRYLCYSRTTAKTSYHAPVTVITDITIVKDSEPIPHGFVAIDYTADSREKSLRKKFICVKSDPSTAVVDAVGEILVLNKDKKTPKDFTNAGTVDGAMICFKTIVIPSGFGMHHSASDSLQRSAATKQALYPPISSAGLSGGVSQSTPTMSANVDAPVNAFTIKQVQRPKIIDGVPFLLHAQFTKTSQTQDFTLPTLPTLDYNDLERRCNFNFALERSILG